jgi:hypothetical protein
MPDESRKSSAGYGYSRPNNGNLQSQTIASAGLTPAGGGLSKSAYAATA